MKTLPIVLLGVLILAGAGLVLFVPAATIVRTAKSVTTIFVKKAAPAPVLHMAPLSNGASVPLAVESVSISAPEVADASNKIIDAIKNGLGTLSTLLGVILGFRQLKPIQEKRKAAKAAKKKVEDEKPRRRDPLRVTSRPK